MQIYFAPISETIDLIQMEFILLQIGRLCTAIQTK